VPLFKRILVPLDYSEPSREALKTAVYLADQLHASITCLHVIDIRYTATVPAYLVEPAPDATSALRESAQQRLDAMVEELAPNRDVKVFVEVGVPSEGILDHAHAASIDLIVMGSHGRTGLKRAVLGSQAELTVRRSPVPVLVVHAKDTKDASA
jgi:nucleotide-binding universal stress UspA family protein